MARREIAGATYDNRGDAARALGVQLPRYGFSRPLRFPDERIEFGWWPGTDGSAHSRLALITTQETLGADMVIHVDDRSASGLMGVLTRATNQVRGLPAKVSELAKRLEDLGTQVAQVEGADRSEFGRRDELVAARHRLAELSVELEERYAPAEQNPPSVTEPVGPSGLAETRSRSATRDQAPRRFGISGMGLPPSPGPGVPVQPPTWVDRPGPGFGR